MNKTPETNPGFNLEKSGDSNAFIKWLNYILIGFTLIAILKMNIFPIPELGRGITFMVTIFSLILFIPYIISLQAFPPKRQLRKTSLTILPIWILLVISGIFARKDSSMIVSISCVYLAIAIANFLYILLVKD